MKAEIISFENEKENNMNELKKIQEENKILKDLKEKLEKKIISNENEKAEILHKKNEILQEFKASIEGNINNFKFVNRI